MQSSSSRPTLGRSPCCASLHSSLAQEDDEAFFELAPPTTRPTLSQLAALTAVPSGMLQGSRRRAKKPPGKLLSKGQSVNVFFNEAATRPVPRNGISIEQGITIELTQDFGNFLLTSTTLPAFASSAFSLANFSTSTSLIAVFDQYRFRQIEVWLEPIAPAGSSNFGFLASAIDLDDNNLATTIATVAEKQQSLSGRGGAGHYHKWVPHMAVAAYSGAFTSYTNVLATWIDSASTGVQHYGLKVAAGNTPSSAIQYALTVRAVVDFRAPSNN